jgi:hypothetical protein
VPEHQDSVEPQPGYRKHVLSILFLITVATLLIHGYHPGAEDGEIYIPGIKKILNPQLYPFGAEFFLNHARLTLFDELIAASVRLSRLPFDWVLFLWYVASAFLTLFACWRLSRECFEEPEAQWAGVLLVGALFTIPVAGTSLYIADQYLTSRSIVTFAVLFAIWNAWKGRTLPWILWSAFAVCVHPLMAMFGISYAVLVRLLRDRIPSWLPGFGVLSLFAVMPLISLQTLIPMPSAAYQQAVATRSYFFILQWHWYELLGAVAPLLLVWLMGRYSDRNKWSALPNMSVALIIYALCYFILALIITIPVRFEALARLQPMRSLHLVYILMCVWGGGILGKCVLKQHRWRWIVVFGPLCAGMFVAQRELFPSSAHIEWPAATPSNDWLKAFQWISRNTPEDAVFAIDPDYMRKDDQHGFRAIAERSRLADAIKDAGAVTMFPEPPTAEHWLEQTNAQAGWGQFRTEDFRRLKQIYGVSWLVLERPARVSFNCPYQNSTLEICRVN